MATRSITEAEELISCPVCFEHYRDPRTLPCAHQFCLECLEKISTVRLGQAEITCPTCSAVTPLPSSSGVRNLPRPFLMNEIQGMIKRRIITRGKKTADTRCDVCEVVDKMAATHCYDCRENMCDTCYQEHEEIPNMATHKTTPVSDVIFCDVHNDVITTYCRTCCSCICNRCLRHNHKKHEVEHIRIAAEKIRKQMDKFIHTHKNTDRSSLVDKIIPANKATVEGKYDRAIGQMDRTLDVIQKLKRRIEGVKSELMVKKSSNINKLKHYEAQINVGASLRANKEESRYLLDKASDPELVIKANELDLSCVFQAGDLASPPPVSVPELAQTVYHTERINNESLQASIIRYKTGLVGDISGVRSGGTAPMCLTQIAEHRVKPACREMPVCRVIGVLILKDKSQLIIQTNDPSSPMEIHDFKLKFLSSICGEDLDRDLTPVKYDVKRHLFLAAKTKTLYTFSVDGTTQAKIPLQYHVSGTAYAEREDLYLLSTLIDERIIVVDPKTQSIVKTFTSFGEAEGLHHDPKNICTYTDKGKDYIVVSDNEDHRIHVLDTDGNNVQTYGSCHGDGCGELCGPRGVAVGPGGSILVCDNGNKRVVSFWMEQGEIHSRCLLTRDQFITAPFAIDVDLVNKVIVVTERTKVYLYSY